MKTYGKQPEALLSITKVMLRDLADFPPEKILNAFKLHAQRSDEFPTTADIIGLIKRNGRPPLRESDIIAIRKKPGDTRTDDEWAMLREWEAQQQDGWRDESEPMRDTSLAVENARLRQEVIGLKGEIKRLSGQLHEARMAKGLEKPKPSQQQKLADTVKAMRDGGATEADIDEFLLPYGGVAALA